jgi:hypothetical protein
MRELYPNVMVGLGVEIPMRGLMELKARAFQRWSNSSSVHVHVSMLLQLAQGTRQLNSVIFLFHFSVASGHLSLVSRL